MEVQYDFDLGHPQSRYTGGHHERATKLQAQEVLDQGSARSILQRNNDYRMASN
jgi:hypothetical protein